MRKNIKSFGKSYDYLADPELRQKEAGGAPLIIRNAKVSGVNFHELVWQNVEFVDCDFVGGYEIKLRELKNARFENCRFAGIISWGVASSVRYVRCQVGGSSNIIDFSGSTDVRFEDCTFIGTDADPNHRGGIGSRGDAVFIRCKAKWFSLAGYTRIELEDCETQDVATWTDSHANSGANYRSAVVSIKTSKLRGQFDMGASDLQSLTIRDTVLDNLDLTNATVKGDVVLERIKGGALSVSIEGGAGNFVLRDSEIYGDEREIGGVYAGAFKTVLVENNVFGGGPGNPAIVAGGFEPDEKEPQPMWTQSVVIRNNKIPALRSGRLNAARVRIEGNTIESLDLHDSRINRLELIGNTISRSVDFTNTQVKESRVQPLAKGQAKLDGSNVKVG